ncbi:hypothetical protein [Candidatus Nitrosocosmicus sp. T]
MPTDTRDRQETPSPKQTIPPTIGDNVLQQEDGVLETQPADEGMVQEPSANEIKVS